MHTMKYHYLTSVVKTNNTLRERIKIRVKLSELKARKSTKPHTGQ